MVITSISHEGVGAAGRVSDQESSTIALCDLIALLNKAMQESALTQSKTTDALSKGLEQTSTLLKTYNDQISEQLTEIKGLNDSREAVMPWLVGFSVAGMVLGFGAAAAAGASIGLAATAVSAGSSIATIGAGAASIAEGVYTLKLGNTTADLADKNGTVSGLTGAQQIYQSMNKWATDQIGSTFTTMSDMSKSGSSGVKAVYDGVSMAGKDMLRGVLGQKI
jgi:hypothetical protein